MISFKHALISAVTLASIIGYSGGANANQQAVTLNGAISAVSCEVVLNGGSSTLNVGTYAKTKFAAAASTQVGTVPLVVSLTGCDKDSTADSGALYIQGTTANGSNSIFVNNENNNVGFMLKDANGTQVVNNQPIKLDVKAGSTNYSFSAGMGATTKAPANRAYSAPIVIAYISD